MYLIKFLSKLVMVFYRINLCVFHCQQEHNTSSPAVYTRFEILYRMFYCNYYLLEFEKPPIQI
jgi:hypothetical protein